MTDGGLSTVFFSYSRDDRARALPILRLIEQAGYNLWWDGLLEGGERFSRTTEDALERAKAVVVLWSKTSVQSHWVHDEATRGRDRRVLVPLSLDGSMPPLGFGQFQVIDLSKAKLNAKDTTVQRMLRAVAALHGEDVPFRAPVTPSQGIDRRVLMGGGVALAAAAGSVAAWQLGMFGGSAIANRIAVLPFKNLSGDAKQDYLSEGLSTEIRSTLAQNGALQVVGQASSEAFAEKKTDLVTMAKQLKVDYLLDGSVRAAGDKMRVTIELIDGKTGITRPPRNFDAPGGEVLTVQREIASAVAAELTSTLGGGSDKKPVGGTSNVLAYDHYLRGKDLYAHAKDEAEEREAVTQFEAAIAADPKFAAAYAGKSRALSAVAGQYGGAAEIKLFHDAAVAAARQAVALAPDLADAQSTLAFTLFQGGLDVKSARKPFDQSRKAGEGEASVMARFAFYCAATGRDREAVPAIDRALTLDPLNALIHRVGWTVHYAARRYPQAAERAQEALRINANLAEGHSRLGMALLMQGKTADALKQIELEQHKWSRLAALAIVRHRLGDRKAAEAAMAGLTGDKEVVSLYQQGQVLSQWGKPDEAVETLRVAYDQRDAGMTALRYDPMLDPLRKHPRFIILLKTMGFD